MKADFFSQKMKIVLFIISAFILTIVLLTQYYLQYTNLKVKFEQNIENIIEREITNNISSLKGVINSLSSYYQSTIEMDTSSFSELSNDLIQDYTYIDAIAFATVVEDKEKEDFVNEIRDNGLYYFSINDMNKKYQIIKSKRFVPKYAPIIYIAPANYIYTKFYGLDLYNNHIFGDAFFKASRTDKVIIKDQIVINELKEEMTLFIKSTYKDSNHLGTDEDRIKKTNGFYIIVVDFQKLFLEVKKEFFNYNILILKKDQVEGREVKSFYNKLRYLKKISSLENSYFSITKTLSIKDFDILPFVLLFIITLLIQGLLVVIWYINKSTKNELNYRATHDELTSLVNRAYFKEQLNRKIKNKNNNTEGMIAILFIDIDRFKDINDSLGHKFGDQVLIEISKKFKKVLGSRALVSRHGGDEFLIAIDKITDSDLTLKFVEEIIQEINKPLDLDTHRIFLTISMGISIYPNDADNEDDLLRNADAAMYKAKDDGKNTFKFYDKDMTIKVMQKVTLINELKDAIIKDEFILYFQPQYNGATYKYTGMEVLVRWINKEGILISPLKFIPLAEETGMIIELDRLVMKKAFKQFILWREQGLNTGTLSLNLSMKQLNSSDFTEVFKNELTRHDIDPKYIELEVTESVIMNKPIQTIAKLNDLHDFGIKLSVDDFGTGYSSLAYLKKLPISKLKIDKTFIDNLPHDEEDIAIVRSIIALGKSLNLEIIAEGVENIEQKNFLLKNGCDNIQGYFYSKPLDAEGIENLLSL